MVTTTARFRAYGIVLLALAFMSGCGSMGVGTEGTSVDVDVTIEGAGSGGVTSSDISTGSGVTRIDCLEPCKISFIDAGGGGTLFLFATPADGSVLTSFVGTCAPAASCSVTENGDALTLNFQSSGDNIRFDATATFDPAPPPSVASVTLSPNPFSIDVMATAGQAITATVRDTDGSVVADEPIVWTNSAPGVVSLTPAGDGQSATVAPLAVGGAVITATAANGVSGTANVTVETSAPVVISSDMEVAAEWFEVLRNSSGGVTSVASHPVSGGNTGAYRDIQHVFPGAGMINVFHGFSGETYDPSTQGAITSVSFSAFRRRILPVGSSAIGATFALQQGGTIYAHSVGENITTDAWTLRSTGELTAIDFSDGGPDFSSAGGPITFGFIRSNTRGTASAATIVHGTDDFRVEIRR